MGAAPCGAVPAQGCAQAAEYHPQGFPREGSMCPLQRHPAKIPADTQRGGLDEASAAGPLNQTVGASVPG